MQKFAWPGSVRPLIIIVGVLLACLTIGLSSQKADALSAEYIVNLTNEQRSSAGLQPLSSNKQLSSSAHAKAQHMLANNYWSHDAPDGISPWVFIKNSGYDYTRAGENLAKDFGSEVAAVTAWMNSPAHRKNILHEAYQDIGIAVVRGQLDGRETFLVVAHYGASSRQFHSTGVSQDAELVQPLSVRNRGEIAVDQSRKLTLNIMRWLTIALGRV
jgi:uncharacterized protein YkwD